MKKVLSFLRAAAGILMVAAFALGLVAVFRAVSGGVTPAQEGYPPPGETLPVPPAPTWPPGYPPPPPTVSAPEMATMMAEVTASEATKSAEATTVKATVRAQMTASAPAPIPTFTPLPGGQSCYIDAANHFSLFLAPGWHAEPPPSGATAGDTILYNYDTATVGGEGDFPPGGMKIQMGISELGANQSFEQWLSERIALETSAAPVSLTATTPSPYMLGRYTGFSFVISGYGPSVLEIVLLSERKVVIVGLMPSDSPAIPEALSMLSTLDTSGADSCPSPLSSES